MPSIQSHDRIDARSAIRERRPQRSVAKNAHRRGLVADCAGGQPAVGLVDLHAPIIRGRQGDGMLDLRNWRKRAWDPACMTAGVRATPYDCRDTFASLLIHEGRPV